VNSSGQCSAGGLQSKGNSYNSYGNGRQILSFGETLTLGGVHEVVSLERVHSGGAQLARIGRI